MDIQAPDRLGLLYNLLRGMAEANVNIVLSRIATEKGAAIDTFYVTNAEGRKIRDSEGIEALQKALQHSKEPDPTLYDHLGDIHARLKEFNKARDAWRKSLELEPNDEIRKKLDATPGETGPAE